MAPLSRQHQHSRVHQSRTHRVIDNSPGSETGALSITRCVLAARPDAGAQRPGPRQLAPDDSFHRVPQPPDPVLSTLLQPDHVSGPHGRSITVLPITVALVLDSAVELKDDALDEEVDSCHELPGASRSTTWLS